jgi:hypothetical protein
VWRAGLQNYQQLRKLLYGWAVCYITLFNTGWNWVLAAGTRFPLKLRHKGIWKTL